MTNINLNMKAVVQSAVREIGSKKTDEFFFNPANKHLVADINNSEIIKSDYQAVKYIIKSFEPVRKYGFNDPIPGMTGGYSSEGLRDKEPPFKKGDVLRLLHDMMPSDDFGEVFFDKTNGKSWFEANVQSVLSGSGGKTQWDAADKLRQLFNRTH